ncbi:MAG: hypothetical protein SFW36_12810, partial [Leptolyngbyaceae cyanobacterium bins.59]|nr:hypothetical protein [Leptolyngbyaceae cyanobacterium bins.59]
MSQSSGWSSTGAWLTTLALVAGSTAPLMMYTPASAAPLSNGEVSGFIRAGMPAIRFRNQSKKNAPFERALGEEYTFTANRGDELEFQVDPEDGSNLQAILVLVSLPSGKQVAFTDRSNFLKYKVPTAGQYKLLVLAKGTTRGRYTLFTEGIGQTAATP